MLNVTPLNAARAPRSLVRLNGSAIGAVISWQIDNNSNYQADTFRVDLAAGKLLTAQNAAWLTAQADLSVEILAGFPANPNAPTAEELTSFIIGRVDDVLFDPVQNTITLSGRDYTSQLIDTKTTETFNNQSAADVVRTLAARHNMTANATSNATWVGSYYEIDHRRLTDEHTEWDLLTWLAHQEQCSVWVSGTTLNFQPLPDPSTAETYVIQWIPPTASSGAPQANVIDLKFARNLTLAKDVTVIVHSWNTKQKKGFQVSAKATHTKNKTLRNTSIPYGEPQVFTQTIPDLTQQQAQVQANSLLASISAHEVRLEASLPADNILSTHMLVTVRGTGTAFDQVYYPDSVVRSMSVGEGYRMELSAKNHSPESTVSP
jgi:phage protein D